MTPVAVLITIASYFLILFTISYIAGRKADNEGFFVGNRKSAWYVVGFRHDRLQHIRSYFCISSGYGRHQ